MLKFTSLMQGFKIPIVRKKKKEENTIPTVKKFTLF